MAQKRVEPEIASVTIAANQLTTSHVPDQQYVKTAISHILQITINVSISHLNRKFLQLRLKKRLAMQMQKKVNNRYVKPDRSYFAAVSNQKQAYAGNTQGHMTTSLE